ncbi:MAG: hypothetical protein BIFFINMI_00064 [Phycisphaerae bacterium]|nr:hypothetical protein [Phycisphaerae bacterium]
MAGDESSHKQLRSFLRLVGVIVSTACSLAAVGLVWLAIASLERGQYGSAVVAGLALLSVAVAAVLWYALSGAILVTVSQSHALHKLARQQQEEGQRQAKLLTDLVDRLDTLAHWTAMSEATRSLLVRQREFEVFRKQIESAIGEADWAEAERLIDLFREHFKDTERTAQLVNKLDSARSAADDRHIRTRIAEVRKLIDDGNFAAADMALGRLAADHPDDARLDDLRATFTRARKRYTEDGEQRFHRLVAENRLDDAAMILDELAWVDAGLIGELRDKWNKAFKQGQVEAKESFRVAMRKKEWSRALTLGEAILHRFADTPLAGEVRRVIDIVRDRARAAAARPAAAAPKAQAQPPRQ